MMMLLVVQVAETRPGLHEPGEATYHITEQVVIVFGPGRSALHSAQRGWGAPCRDQDELTRHLLLPPLFASSTIHTEYKFHGSEKLLRSLSFCLLKLPHDHFESFLLLIPWTCGLV